MSYDFINEIVLDIPPPKNGGKLWKFNTSKNAINLNTLSKETHILKNKGVFK